MNALETVKKEWPITYEYRSIVYLMQNYSLIYLATQSLINPNELGRNLAKRAVSKLIQKQSKNY